MSVGAKFSPLTVAVPASAAPTSAGKTIMIAATLSPGTVAVFPAGTETIMAQVLAPGGAAAYIRISTEASTVIAATSSTLPDTPLFGSGITGTPTIRLFAAAGGPSSTTTVAVCATITGSTVTCWLTPGTGGFGP